MQAPGERVALVGESGCGKTQTALSLMGLNPANAFVSADELSFAGQSLLQCSDKDRTALCGNDLAMVFQEPMTALNPLMKIGTQIAETAVVHGYNRQEAERRARERMAQVGLKDIDRLWSCYPHQLSGGMRQRVMIAAALVNHPKLLVADEPTTALDVTTQAQILQLLRELSEIMQLSVLLISHDLEVVRRLCSRVYLMYAGVVVESGPVQEVLQNPLHPYTLGLLSSVPSFAKRGQPLRQIPGSVPPLHVRTAGGCPFASRCAWCNEQCRTQLPPVTWQNGHMVRCWQRGGAQ